MSTTPPVLADFGRQVRALRSVVQRLGEDACTAAEMARVQDLTRLLQTVERMEAGLHMLAMRGAKPRDIQGHVESINAGDVIWGDL